MSIAHCDQTRAVVLAVHASKAESLCEGDDGSAPETMKRPKQHLASLVNIDGCSRRRKIKKGAVSRNLNTVEAER